MATNKNSDQAKDSKPAPTKSQPKTQVATEPAPQADNQLQPKPDRQSQLATILIGLLIIASGLLLYNYFQNANTPETKTTTDQTQHTTPTPSTTQLAKATPTPKPTVTPAASNANSSSKTNPTTNNSNYTVQAGDSLWTIAEKVYGNGFDWVKIDQANHINKNAVGQPVLEAGQQLTIPSSAAATSQPSNTIAQNNAAPQQLTQTPATAIQTYTVQRGDTLWSIAQAVYGKGEDWTKIYQDPQNNLNMRQDGVPLIHAGNVLVIPQTE